MAPLRRRASRRVVKSTFQECFEYDIPGFRAVEVKRPVVAAARNRPIPKIKTKPKPKQESPSKSPKKTVGVGKNERIKKETTNIVKEEPKNIDQKIKETNRKNNTSEKLRKVKSSLSSIRKVKNTLSSSDYKRFKVPLTNIAVTSKTVSKNESPAKTSSKSSTASERNFESKTWQPVVSLEKLSVNTAKSSKLPEQSEGTTSRNQCSSGETLALATRLKNALKDPMAESEDVKSNLPDNKAPNTALVEVLRETRAIKARTALSRKALQEEGVSSPKKTLKNISDKLIHENKAIVKYPESDSALEDWPESTSEASEQPQSNDFDLITSTSALTDWASPQISLMFLLKKQFDSVTKEFKSSFERLSSIIKEKNVLIATLKNKLDSLSDNSCHRILDNILLDYDKNDPQNPATVIINSILDYHDSHC